MSKFSIVLATSFLFCHDICEIHGFPITANHPPTATALKLALANPSDDESNGEFFDLESTRRELESLVRRPGVHSLEQRAAVSDIRPTPSVHAFSASVLEESAPLQRILVTTTLPSPPPLTTIERERRRLEIQLLSQLIDGEDTLADIKSLWFSERGPIVEAVLLRAEDMLLEGPRGWREAEEILLSVVNEYGVYFVEPVHLLATLYYLQNRPEEAVKLCKMVLSVKPWHYGALSCIVRCHAALCEHELAQQWAARRLPQFSFVGTNRRRSRWVERAVLDAYSLLTQAERRLVESFGDVDDHSLKSERANDLFDEDLNAWQ